MTAHGLRQLSGTVSSYLYHRTWNVYVWYLIFCGSLINYILHISHILKCSVFSCVWGWNEGEDPKGRKRRSGNYFPHHYFSTNIIHPEENSISIQHLAPQHEKCFCCLCNFNKHGVEFWFQKEQLHFTCYSKFDVVFVLCGGETQNTLPHNYCPQLKVEASR